MSTRPLRIGTRGSQLARWQSDWVAARLVERGVTVEIVEITTRGDVQQSGPVAALGVTGVFTKEIQAALLEGAVDLAVHSLKDLPTEGSPRLRLVAVPPRESPFDALVSADNRQFAELPAGARIGTSSLRRRAQLLALRSDLNVLGIRGNVDTRLRKLDAGEYDAIVLAAAGLNRLALGDRIAQQFDPAEFLPAPGQGAMAIECRADDDAALAAVAPLNDDQAFRAVTAERAVLARLHGGCSAPIAAFGRMQGADILLDAVVVASDGARVLRARGESGDDAVALGQRVADDLLAQGAAEIISACRGA
jgi:hydroxymethylbilane synthase